MPRTDLTRRRFVAISAVFAATASWPARGIAAPELLEWRGVALGAAASIRLAHPDADTGRALLRRCVTEVRRLEGIFSLYDAESALCRLNRHGALDLPPFELVELLSYAAQVSAATEGAFDVTVQPLWRRFAEHFAVPGADPAGPLLADVLPLVDWRRVSFGSDRITLQRAGMAVTLNGVAQGYITDRIADLLRGEGMRSVLVDLGEVRALGSRPGGGPWRIGLADATDPARVAQRVNLADAALATSGGYGTAFVPDGWHNHLIDPRSGHSAPARRSVSVIASSAAVADAASTALALLPEGEAPDLLRELGATAAYIQDEGGLRMLRV
ncbi:MAG: FAD:protein FMN transferase [Kiloniellaceae bacterium]